MPDPTPEREIELEPMVETLSVGSVMFGSLPYDLSDDEAEALFKERAERDARRIPMGFRT